MDPAFAKDFWNSPLVSNIAFVPRPTPRTGRDDAQYSEGEFSVGGGITLGWCLFKQAGEPAAGAPTLIYAHANAETAAEVASLAPLFHAAGCAAVLAFDYRGYGFSTGAPTVGTLLPDCEAVATALPGLLQSKNLAGRPLVVYGRSLGAACAIHIVSLAPEKYAGLVVDSGLQDIRSLPMVGAMAQMMPNGQELLRALPDPFETSMKLSRVTCPLLVLHSERDEIIPFAHGQMCLRAATSAAHTQLHAFKDSGHNDIIAKHRDDYTRVLTAFLRRAANTEPASVEDAATLRALSVRELRQRVAAQGLDARACIEKEDFVQLLL